MLLKTISINNFLGTQKAEYSFNQINNISGRNGSGKSTIKEAILFALYGRVNGTTLVDGAVTKGNTIMSVVLSFSSGGNNYILERVKGLSIKLNGTPIAQHDIDTKFGSYENFLSAISAGDFMKFEQADRYKIMSEIFGSDLQSLYEQEMGALAEKYPFGTFSIEDVNKKIKEASASIDRIHYDKLIKSNLIDELSQKQCPQATITEEQIGQVRMTLSDHEAKKPRVEQAASLTADESAMIRSNIGIVEAKIKKLMNSKPDRDELNRIATLYERANNELNVLDQNAICLSCNRPFDKSAIEDRKVSLTSEIQFLLSEGKRLKEAYLSDVDGWEKAKLLEEEELAGLKNRLTAIQETREMDTRSAMAHIQKELDLWQERHDEIVSNINTLSQKFREEQTAISLYNQDKDRIDSLKQELGKLDVDLQNIPMGDYVKLKEVLGPKGIEFKDMQEKAKTIQGYLPDGVEIELLQPNKTNEGFKKVFNLVVDGVGYNWLSKGMRKNIDIHLCELLTKTLGTNLIIIDDLESMTSRAQLHNHDIQLITMTAKDCDLIFE